VFGYVVASILTALLCLGHALPHAEMPIHVRRLLLLPFCVRLEPSATLATLRSKFSVQSRE
jgi:hypothetical protein